MIVNRDQIINFGVLFLFLIQYSFDWKINLVLPSLYLIYILLYIYQKVGFFRLEFIVFLILIYPALTPIISTFFIGFPLVASVGLDYQNIDLMSSSVLISSIFIGFIFLFNINLIKSKNPISFLESDFFNKKIYILLIFLCFLFLIIIIPGENIITGTYKRVVELRQERGDSHRFAGAFFLAAWSYTMALVLSRKKYLKSFFMISILIVLIFFAFGQRSEAIGVVLAIIAFLGIQSKNIFLKSNIKKYILATLFISISIGYWRSLSLQSLFSGGLSQINLIDSNIGGIRYPGGAGEIFIGLPITLSFIESEIYNFPLYGQTLANFFMRWVPTGLYSILDVEIGPTYYEILSKNIQLVGGTYYVAEIFGNFRMIGVVLAGVVWGLIVRKIIKIYYEPMVSYKTVIVIIFLTTSIKVFWFNQINLIKVLIGFILLIYLTSIFRIRYENSLS